MATDCTPAQIELQGFPKRRRLVASFDGGEFTSDGGALLLEQADRATKLLDRFAACFVDHRRRKSGGYGGLDFGIVDSLLPKDEVSTKPGQLQFPKPSGIPPLQQAVANAPAKVLLLGPKNLYSPIG